MAVVPFRAIRAWAIAVSLLLPAAPALAQNLLINGGFEDYPTGDGGGDAPLQASGSPLLSGVMTVDANNAEFQKILGTWGRGANGNWTGAPNGTAAQGLDAAQTRKPGLKWFQALSLDAVGAGDDLFLDWQYYVGTTLNDTNSGAGTAVTNQVVVFGVNQAAEGETATTIHHSTGALAGAAGNFAVLANVTLTIPAGAADGLWHNAPTTLVQIADDWDYIGLYFNRTAGVTNVTTQMMDNFALTPVPEPAALSGVVAAVFLLCRRRARATR